MNTLEQVQSQITANLQAFTEGKIVQLVAGVDGTIVGIVSFERSLRPLTAHRAEVTGLVVNPKSS